MTIEITWQLIAMIFGIFIYSPLAIFFSFMLRFRYDNLLLCWLLGAFWPLTMIWEWIDE